MVLQDTEVVGVAAFRVMFEHSSEGVLFGTQDGRITAANPAACAMLDMSAEEICRLGRDGLVDQEDPRWDIAVAERERTGSAVGVARLRRGDGRYMETEMTALQFRDEDGSSQMCCMLHDLTGRMAIEREIEELSARLLQLSHGDELTGLQNRRGLLAAGTQLLQVADRQSAPVHVLFVDVANVQELNERLGHHAGDAALQAVARALSVTFHKHDVLARIGGTQFLVLALRPAETDCGALANRIRDHLGAPETTEFVGATVEVCCGWTTRPVGDRTSLEDLVARSDWAMHESREGRQGAWEPLPAAGA
jgi:diguanylate cyclase (GGDEF)-like protein/PAS domain S-box-containing protein